jgi:hypothetical protein
MLDETVNLEWVDGDPEVGQKRPSRRSEPRRRSTASRFLERDFGLALQGSPIRDARNSFSASVMLSETTMEKTVSTSC